MHSPIIYPADLPIIDQKNRIVELIQEKQVVIISGETGSGKSTQLPKMCLEAGRGKNKIIGCSQPRRIAASALAARVSHELEPDKNHLVGFAIRFRYRTDQHTRIKFMTDGILLAETQRDKKLSAYDTIIIDEAHERSLNIDFLLGYLKNLLKQRKDLKLIITSATIDTQKFSDHFNQASVLEVSGKTYPVEIQYQPPEINADNNEYSYVDHATEIVCSLLKKKKTGDILIFMPTERDILETAENLSQAHLSSKGNAPLILPLFARLRAVDQSRIFKPSKQVKVVIATNIAETSITVPGIKYVIDTGLARLSSYNARARTTSLPVRPISKASCDQRQGRCGRVAPGVCIRLYSEEDYKQRPAYTLPEIKRSNLAEVILRMIALKLGDPAIFPFVDPPNSRAIKDGYALLSELGAIHLENKVWRLTANGKIMAKMPIDPRIARIIIEARDHNALRETIIIAAALSISDPRKRPAEKKAQADAAHAKFTTKSSDFLGYLAIWNIYHNTLTQIKSRSRIRKFCANHFLSYQRMREWRDIHEQLTNILKEFKSFTFNIKPASYDAIHQAIISGFLRNIAMKKEKNIYLGANNKEVMIFPGSSQYNRAGQWIVAADFIETSKLYARMVADIKVEWLEKIGGALCRYTYSEPHWEKKRGQVVALEKVTLFGLMIVTGRKINFGSLNTNTRKEARDIFINSALVCGDLGGRYQFLAHNLKLIARIESMEDRVRQRGVLADDYTLYKFYSHRLPDDVYDRKSLNRHLKRKKTDKFLWMHENDILFELPKIQLHEDFPKTLTVNNFSFSLSYKFNPGSVEDGITVTIPIGLLPTIPPVIFEWLVPGLLLEKITFLLKGLPKSIRKQLIPISKTAQKLLQNLTPYQGSLLRNLENLIYTNFKIKINPDKWPVNSLPDHLTMRYRLVDSKGIELKTCRLFPQAEQSSAERSDHPELHALRKIWEKEAITSWDFVGLPDKIPLKTKSTIHGYAYPTLVFSKKEKKSKLDLKLISNEEESRKLTSKGLIALYTIYLPRPVRSLKAECVSALKNLDSDWTMLNTVFKHKQLDKHLLEFILQELLKTETGVIPDQQTFFATIDKATDGWLYLKGADIIAQVINIIKKRKDTSDYITKFEKAAKPSKASKLQFQNYRSQLDNLLPPDFITTFDYKKLLTVERYLKALCIRVERAHASPAKDAAKEAELLPHCKKLEKWEQPCSPTAECLKILAEYKQMLEEFKISLFAQELKTLFPVSAKRIEKKWQELIKFC